MAFNIRYWAKSSVSANANAPVFYVYKATDSFEAVTALGYFNALKNDLKIGDIIQISVTVQGQIYPPSYIVKAINPNVKIG